MYLILTIFSFFLRQEISVFKNKYEFIIKALKRETFKDIDVNLTCHSIKGGYETTFIAC